MDINLLHIECFEEGNLTSPDLLTLLKAMAVVILEQQERIEALECSIDPERKSAPDFPPLHH